SDTAAEPDGGVLPAAVVPQVEPAAACGAGLDGMLVAACPVVAGFAGTSVCDMPRFPARSDICKRTTSAPAVGRKCTCPVMVGAALTGDHDHSDPSAARYSSFSVLGFGFSS